MKTAVLLSIILSLGISASAQATPLTQAEYVKMLYAVQSSPEKKIEIVEALRKRGIGFVLTDGIRGLTRSKAANDDELKRVLEEADRRRQNPVAAQLPTVAEAAGVLEETTKKTLVAVGEMPDFVVKQQIQRSVAHSGTGNFRNVDRLVVAVSYRSSGEESYRLLSLNGAIKADSQQKESYNEAGGTSSTGEFVSMLATIFEPKSQTKFEVIDTDLIRGRRALVYDFEIERDRAKQIITSVGYSTASTVTGMKGRVWIDRELMRVLKVESGATEIPPNFPVTMARRTIDYDWVKIDAQQYLLPSISDVRVSIRERDKIFETRNVIRFKEYQKYGSEVKILDDDITPEPEKP